MLYFLYERIIRTYKLGQTNMYILKVSTNKGKSI
jgi:hypothetical protein